MRIKQSFVIPIMKTPDLSFEKLLGSAAEIGYSAVELIKRDESFSTIVEKTRKYGLSIASMAGHNSLPDGLNKRSNHPRIEKELRESIDVAVEYGITGLICFSGNRQPYTEEFQAIDAVAEGLSRVAPYAEEKGVNLNLELLNSKIDHPGYQCDHTAWGAAVCEKVNSPNVKLLYDIYHMQIMEGDIIRTIRDNIQWIGHFHTAGVPGRNEIGPTQELNYAGICKTIARTGYELYVGHEFKPQGEHLNALRDAFEACDQE